MRHRPRSAFTLIELLVVVSIIAVLGALLLPAMDLVRQQAYTVICQSNARQITLAMITYANDWNGLAMTPWNSASGIDAGWHARVSQFFSDGSVKVFTCPANKGCRPDAEQGTQLIPCDGGYLTRIRRADYAISTANGDYWAWGHSRSRAITWIDGTWVNTPAIWASAGSRPLSQCAGDTALIFESQDRPYNWTAFNGGETSFISGLPRLMNAHHGKNAVGRVDGVVLMLTAAETNGPDPNNLRGAWSIARGD